MWCGESVGIRMVEDRTFDVVLSGVVVTGAEQCGLAAHAVAANAIPYLVVDGFKNCMSLGVCRVCGLILCPFQCFQLFQVKVTKTRRIVRQRRARPATTNVARSSQNECEAVTCQVQHQRFVCDGIKATTGHAVGVGDQWKCARIQRVQIRRWDVRVVHINFLIGRIHMGDGESGYVGWERACWGCKGWLCWFCWGRAEGKAEGDEGEGEGEGTGQHQSG